MKSSTDPKNFLPSHQDRHERRTRLQRSFILHVNDPVKVIARKVYCTPDTVEVHRKALPKNYAQFIEYCRHYPGFALDVIEEMGIDIDANREAYALFLQTQRAILGRDGK